MKILLKMLKLNPLILNTFSLYNIEPSYRE